MFSAMGLIQIERRRCLIWIGWLNLSKDQFEQRGARDPMSKLRTIMWPMVCATVWLSVSNAQAGPCTANIAQFEQAIRQSAGNPYAGLQAPQTVAAQMDRQPTPESLKQAQDRLRSQFSATMARAKRLDARGDRAGCTSALTAARRMYIL
jgi:hypothetical protein